VSERNRVTVAASSLPEVSDGSPGTILRRCREFHGITLEDASETTKIGISHLNALEQDNIQAFANQAYLKGFLRIYATYLGLNSDDISRMYEKLFGVKAGNAEPNHSSTSQNCRHRRLISLKKLIFPALLLAIILITATFFKTPPAPLIRKPPPVAVTVPPVQNAAIQTVQSSATHKTADPVIAAPKVEKSPAEVTEAEMATAPKHPAEAAKGFILKIRVTQNGTLAATVDGSNSQQYELTSGDIIEWKAEKKVTLDLSNAGGVDVELNGKPYKSLGPVGKPVYVELDADGVKP
jgi:cytoskeletal protein RodZ